MERKQAEVGGMQSGAVSVGGSSEKETAASGLLRLYAGFVPRGALYLSGAPHEGIPSQGGPSCLARTDL